MMVVGFDSTFMFVTRVDVCESVGVEVADGVGFVEKVAEIKFVTMGVNLELPPPTFSSGYCTFSTEAHRAAGRMLLKVQDEGVSLRDRRSR